MPSKPNKIWKWLIFTSLFLFCEPALDRIRFTNEGEAWARGGHNRDPFPNIASSDPRANNFEMLTWDLLDNLSKEVKFEGGSKKQKYKNGAKVTVAGFMTPLQTDDAEKRAASFLLTKNQVSYFDGPSLKLNEWIFVSLPPGNTVGVVTDVPVTVVGTLELVERGRKTQNWVMYRMLSENVTFREK
jgi:hypothetical protein